jgi:hypothetical protein
MLCNSRQTVPVGGLKVPLHVRPEIPPCLNLRNHESDRCFEFDRTNPHLLEMAARLGKQLGDTSQNVEPKVYVQPATNIIQDLSVPSARGNHSQLMQETQILSVPSARAPHCGIPLQILRETDSSSERQNLADIAGDPDLSVPSARAPHCGIPLQILQETVNASDKAEAQTISPVANGGNTLKLPLCLQNEQINMELIKNIVEGYIPKPQCRLTVLSPGGRTAAKGCADYNRHCFLTAVSGETLDFSNNLLKSYNSDEVKTIIGQIPNSKYEKVKSSFKRRVSTTILRWTDSR